MIKQEIKIGDEVEVIQAPETKPWRWMWNGFVQQIITETPIANKPLEQPIYMVKFSDGNTEAFVAEDVKLKKVLSKKEIEGKWLWHHDSRIFVEKKAPENGFYIIHEPGSPWGPRPVHYDNIKYGEIIDESFKIDYITSQLDKCGGFCSCHFYKMGKPLIQLDIQAKINRWDAEKVGKELQKFLREHGCPHIQIETSTTPWKDGSYEDENLKIRFIDLRDNHDKNQSSE